MRGIDVEMVLKLVEENAKKRFEVVWAYDPSPPLPIKKKGQNKKAKSKVAPAEVQSEEGQGADTAGIDDLRKEMERSMLQDTKADEPTTSTSNSKATTDDEWKELPLVLVDQEEADGSQDDTPKSTDPTWFIRASQGHSIKLEGTAHLTPVEDDEDGRQRVGLMVHGTRDDLWDTIRESSRSRMKCRRPNTDIL
jgi:2'-phosphotransferase